MTSFQAFKTIKLTWLSSGFVRSCSILLLFTLAALFNADSLFAQSSVSHIRSTTTRGIPTSITAAQRSTESMLQRSASTFSIRDGETLSASNLFELLDVTVFIDLNLEGSFDQDTDLTCRTGVSMAKSLQRALLFHDAVYTVEPDGSMLIISIDDEYEPDYLQTVIYDVTSLTGSFSQAQRLAGWMMQSISSDSWEQNGSGNGTCPIYMHNGHVLMAITQSYKVQLQIRRHLSSTRQLGGSTSITAPSFDPVQELQPNRARSTNGSRQTQLASSVVQVPSQHTKSNRRKRRGFSRPDSGSSGGFGGGGSSGGVF